MQAQEPKMGSIGVKLKGRIGGSLKAGRASARGPEGGRGGGVGRVITCCT